MKEHQSFNDYPAKVLEDPSFSKKSERFMGYVIQWAGMSCFGSSKDEVIEKLESLFNDFVKEFGYPDPSSRISWESASKQLLLPFELIGTKFFQSVLNKDYDAMKSNYGFTILDYYEFSQEDAEKIRTIYDIEIKAGIRRLIEVFWDIRFRKFIPVLQLEAKKASDHLKEIVKNQDMTALFLLEDNGDFVCALYEILNEKWSANQKSLNPYQWRLYHVLLLENLGQSSSIASFFEYVERNKVVQMVDILLEMGATKSARAIEQAIQLLPEGSWFDGVSDEKWDKMGEYDKIFSNYPDGLLAPLHRKYAEKYRKEITEGF